MAISFFNVLQSVCTIAHENIPSDFGDITQPYPEIKFYIQNVLEEICDKFAWTFRERLFTLNTLAGQRAYSLLSGLSIPNIIEDGVRAVGWFPPLYFIPSTDLDQLVQSSGKPYRYSVFNGQIILDPTPDEVYQVNIKYLTTNFAFLSDGATEQSNLVNSTDTTIIPDRYIKTLIWGAYAYYRQNFKPDPKYTLACQKYQEYLLEMQQEDNHGGDSGPIITIGRAFNNKARLIRDFYNQR